MAVFHKSLDAGDHPARKWALVAMLAALVFPSILFGAVYSASISGAMSTARVNSAHLQARLLRGAAPVNYAGDPIGCRRPELDLAGLEEYGCKIVPTVCVDQNKVTLFNLKRGDDPPYPFYDFGWLAAFVPGWENENANSGYPGGAQHTPVFRRNSSYDRFDHKAPVFSHCHVPLLWLPTWMIQYGEFLSSSFMPLWVMQHELKLFDTSIDLVVGMAGYTLPKFASSLLEPYTERQVVTLADLGSREHIFDATRPRCFETMVLCRLKGLYSDRPGPKYAVNDTAEYGDLKHTYDGDKDWKWWRPARAGQHLVEYYTKKGAIKPASVDPTTLQIVIATRNGKVAYRNFLNLDDFLADCNTWKPPTTSGFKRAKCRTHSFGDVLVDASALQPADVLIGHHGAELNNAWFMRNGSSVVEVRMKDFKGIWPDTYFRSLFRTENAILYWQAAVVKDGTWKPSRFERAQETQHRVVSRDRNTVLRWPDFEPIMLAILDVNKRKERYEKLTYDEIRWQI